jgi:hypothetical protein
MSLDQLGSASRCLLLATDENLDCDAERLGDRAEVAKVRTAQPSLPCRHGGLVYAHQIGKLLLCQVGLRAQRFDARMDRAGEKSAFGRSISRFALAVHAVKVDQRSTLVNA